MLEIAELVSDAGGDLTMDALVKAFLEWQSRKAQSQAQPPSQPNLNIEEYDSADDPPRGALSTRKLRRFDDDDEDLYDDETDEEPEDAAPAIVLPIPDRASFEDVLEDNFKKARRDLEPMCVAVCSVNRIPQIIAKHGRETAQRLLERIAALLCHEVDIHVCGDGRFMVPAVRNILQRIYADATLTCKRGTDRWWAACAEGDGPVRYFEDAWPGRVRPQPFFTA